MECLLLFIFVSFLCLPRVLSFHLLHFYLFFANTRIYKLFFFFYNYQELKELQERFQELNARKFYLKDKKSKVKCCYTK